MDNYKIKVNGTHPLEYQDILDVASELGYDNEDWGNLYNVNYLFLNDDGSVGFSLNGEAVSDEHQELTLPQLRDLVAQSKAKSIEFLEPQDDGTYKLINWTCMSCPPENFIELPEGTEVVRRNLQGSLNFYKKIDGHWALKNKVDMNNWYQPKPYSSHFDADDGSLPVVWQRHAKHSVGALLDGLDELREEYKDYPKQTEQGLISGADALAMVHTCTVQYSCDKDPVLDRWTTITDHFWDQYNLGVFLNKDTTWKFRIKPRTIKLSLEIPAPFEPKRGETAFLLTNDRFGYMEIEYQGHSTTLGAWRTEEEIKQVVAALRGIKG